MRCIHPGWKKSTVSTQAILVWAGSSNMVSYTRNVGAKINRVREGNGRRFQGRRKGKEKSFCFVVVQFELIFRHPCYLCRLCMHWILWWGWSLHWEEWISGAVSSAKSWWFTEWLTIISERGVVYRTKRMGPSTEPWGTPYMSCDGDEADESVIDWSGVISDWEVWVQPLECSRLNAKNRVTG